jgi:hypothetical protein
VRKTVNSSSLIKTVSTNHLLIPMILALDEARLVNSIVASKEMIKDIKAKDPYSDRLIHLKREIRRFETELARVRKLTDRKKLLSNV